MAGGIYNPFGFGGGEVPQPVPRRMPQDIPAAPFGFAPPPSKWDQVKQALWETNINAPIRGVYNLMNADPYTLYSDTGAAGQQAATDSFDAGGGITVGSAMIPKPSNALSMGIKAYHGSPVEDLVAFDNAELGGNFPNRASKAGHWFSTNPDDAEFFGPNVYEVEIDGDHKSLPSMEEMAKSVRDKINDVAYSRRPSDDYRDTPQVASNFVEYLDATQSPKFHTDVTASRLSKAKRDGYDGAVLKGGETVQDSSDSGDHIVVFKPELIKIVRKLGIAGASAMLGYNLLEGINPAQADELKRIEAGK